MDVFALEFDSDLNAYYLAVPVSDGQSEQPYRRRELLQFTFASDDGSPPDAVIFACVDASNPLDYAAIEDAISSYIDAEEMVSYTQLVQDVLDSFGYRYELFGDFEDGRFSRSHEFVI